MNNIIRNIGYWYIIAVILATIALAVLGVLLTNSCKSLSSMLRFPCLRVTKKLYSQLKGLIRWNMPDYPEQKWGIYNLRLRPADSTRMAMAKLGLPDILNYFNSDEIKLNLRISVPNNKEYKDFHDTIKYEWILCTQDDKPVIKDCDPRFHFYDPDGSGIFELATKKQPKAQYTGYLRYENSSVTMIFKQQAVKIGTYSKLGNYKIVMHFTDSLGNKSDYIRMAQFNILNKDQFRHWILLTILGLIATGIAGIILRACGIGS